MVLVVVVVVLLAVVVGVPAISAAAKCGMVPVTGGEEDGCGVT